jgi:MFS transporter, OFA family, oxalate/formate antiporter
MLRFFNSRWIYAVIFSCINLILGNSYSYSFIRPVIETKFQIGSDLSALPLIASLLSFCTLMFFNSRIVARFGNIKTFWLGLFLLALGYIGSGFVNDIYSLTLFFGIIAGSGVGVLYSSTLIATGLWYPDKKGLAIGITTSGFGLSPLFITFIFRDLIANFGLSNKFLYLGFVSSALIAILITRIKLPDVSSNKDITVLEGCTTKEMIKKRLFWVVYFCFTIAMVSGLIVVGTTAPLAMELVYISKDQTAFLVAFLALPNFFGRIFYGLLSTKFDLKQIAFLSFLFTTITSTLIATRVASSFPIFIFCMITIWFSFGGWLSLSPASIAKFFGAKNYAKNYGLTFTGYGIGGLIGLFVSSYVKSIYGNYSSGYWLVVFLSLIGMILTFFLQQENV